MVNDDPGGGSGVQLTDGFGSTPGRLPSALKSSSPQPLAPLVSAAQNGCSASFELIYRRLAGQVASYLRWHRASDPDGRTNDVFAQVHRNLAGFAGDEQGFRSWLFTIAHHRMIDDRRRASRQPEFQGDAGLGESLVCG